MSKVDAALLSALIAAPLVIVPWSATLPPLLEVDVPGQENLEFDGVGGRCQQGSGQGSGKNQEGCFHGVVRS